MTRVLLVDDQTIVRQGIRALLGLAAGIEVAGEAGDGREALDLLDAGLQVEVVLLDLRMPRLDGHGFLAELAHRASPPAVLVLTTFDDDEAVLTALRAGARGYLLKDVTLEDLVGAIEEVARGGRLIQPAVTQGLLERIIAGAPAAGAAGDGPAHVPDLTPREKDVLRLMAAGWSNKEIAASLHLAEGTVKNNVSAILLKLGVRDRTRAVLRALELGLA